MRKRCIRNAIAAVCLLVSAALLICMAVSGRETHPAAQFFSTHPAVTLPPVQRLPEEHLFNTGDEVALDELPGVGPVIAQRIIEVRERTGGFAYPEQMMLVPGVGEQTYQHMLDAATPGDLPPAQGE